MGSLNIADVHYVDTVKVYSQVPLSNHHHGNANHNLGEGEEGLAPPSIVLIGAGLGHCRIKIVIDIKITDLK